MLRLSPPIRPSSDFLKCQLRRCSSGAAARLATKIGRPATDLQNQTRIDFLRAKALSVADMKTVASMVTSNPRVQVLDVTGNGFGADAVESLIAILRGCPSLETLAVGNNDLRAGTGDLVEAAASSGSLRSLSVPANAIAGGTCKAIGVALAGNPGLTSLDLSHNAFGPVGCAAVASGLASNRTLASLALASCSVRASGGQRLAEALRAGSVLRSLDLHECYIGADGLAALAAALQGNTTLQVLRLSDNNLAERSGLGSHELSAEEGLAALAALLTTNRTLRSVDLRHNGLDAAQQRALRLAKGEALKLDLV
jgi:Leucine-rich repeat (LRR) protein